MNFSIFTAWMRQFETFVSKTVERRVALLLDDALAHGRIEDLSFLPDFEVFPSQKHYRVLQRLDAAVIGASKRSYLKKQYEYASTSIENQNPKDAYNVNVLQANN